MTWGAVGAAAVSVVGGAIAKNNGPKQQTQGSTAPAKWYSDAGQAAGTRATDIMNRGYSGYAGERIAGLGANEQGALSAAGSLGDKTQPFMSRLQSGFTPGVLDQYANPYTDSVLGARKRSIGEEYGRQSSALASNQAAMDAFRTGRSDLARSRLDANRIRALDEATNQTKSDAWDKSMQAYNNQNQSDIGALGATTNSELGRIGALGATGKDERGIRQGQNDFNYGQFLERRDWDVNNLGPMLEFLRAGGNAAGANSSSTSTGSSGAGGMLGGVAAMAGQFMQNYKGGGGGTSNGNPDYAPGPTDAGSLQDFGSPDMSGAMSGGALPASTFGG